METKWNFAKDRIYCFIGVFIGFLIAMTIGFTYTYDTDTPAGTDAPSVIDDRIREVKDAVQERLNVDHYFALTGSQVSDAATGQHRQIEFYGPISTPSSAANKMWIYGKDVDGKIEAHILDEDGDEIQLTTGGIINSANLSGDQTIAGVKTFSSEPVFEAGLDSTIADGTEPLTVTSTTKVANLNADMVDGKHSDEQFGAWISRINGSSYEAASDGIVCAWSNAANATIKGFTDSSDPPTTQRVGNFGDAAAFNHGITMPVRKGDYWKVTGADTVYFLPIGG